MIIQFPNPNLILSSKQAAVLLSKSPRIIVAGGRGSGKDFLGINWAILHSLRIYASRKAGGAFPRAGATVKVGFLSPTEKHLDETFDQFCDLFPKEIPNRIYVSEPRRCIVFNGDLTFHFYNINESLRGKGFDITQISELINLRNEEDYFKIVEPCINRPMHEGLCFIQSSTGGLFDNWFQKAQKKDAYWGMFDPHHLVTYDNPYITANEIIMLEAKKKTQEYMFRCENMAELFVRKPPSEAIIGETIFTPNQISDAMVSEAEDYLTTPNFSIGCDLAFLGDDEALFITIHIPTKTVVHIEAYQKTTNKQLKEIFEKLYRQWNNPQFYVDCTAPKQSAFYETELCSLPFYNRINRTIIRASSDRFSKFADNFTKDHLVRILENRVINNSIRFPALPLLDANGSYLDIDAFDFNKLPHVGEQNQKQNFLNLYDQLLDVKRKTDTKQGKEIYWYVKGDRVGKDDYFDSLILAQRGLPIMAQSNDNWNNVQKNLSGFWN